MVGHIVDVVFLINQFVNLISVIRIGLLNENTHDSLQLCKSAWWVHKHETQSGSESCVFI